MDKLKWLVEKFRDAVYDNEPIEKVGFLADALGSLLGGIDGIDKYYGVTMMGWAAQCGNVDCVRYLVERGASLDLRDDFNRPAISYAMRTNQVEVVKLLLERGAELDARGSIYFYFRWRDLEKEIAAKR